MDLRQRRRRPLTAVLLAATATLILAGCGGRDVAEGPTIRLVDELEAARIESSLQGLEPWESLQASLGDEIHWRLIPGPGRQSERDCRRVAETRIRCSGRDKKRYSAAFRVDTEPHSHYRIRARVRSRGVGCVRLRLSDTREIRDLSLPPRANAWHQISENWHTLGTEDVLKIDFRGGCAVVVESLEVRKLLMDSAAELSALAAQTPAPFGGVGLGLAKFGSLLPRADAETVAAPFDENWGFREAILAPAPTTVTYTVRVPEEGRLRFSYALAEKSRLGDQVRFEVLVDTRGARNAVIWSQELTLTPDNWHWHEATVDLARWAGRAIELTLRTSSTGERGYGIWGTPTVERPRRSEEPPNIILIAVDTLRADRLSSYGYHKPTSPHVDALAEDGTLFLYPISQSTQTPPAFASLFTGQLVARHEFMSSTSRLAMNVPVLARVLRQNGWTTHAAMFHAALYDHDLARGFERWFNMPRTQQRADQNLQKGLDWLEANGDRRFFFFLHFSDPHQPFTQPPEFVQADSAASLAEYGVEIPFSLRGTIGKCEPCTVEGDVSDEFKRLVRDLYDEEVHYVDDQIGVFLRALKDRGLYDDTIIMFVSDHGETLWDHFDYYEHGGVNQHDELTRVPLIIKPAANRGYASGRVVEQQVQAFDLMPTVLEMVGVDTSPMDMEADSLLPLLLADAGEARYEGGWAYASNERAASVRGNGWKWTWARQVGEGLYDLTNDPLETTNVAAEHPKILRGMRSRHMEMQLTAVGGRYLLVLEDGEDLLYRIRVQTPGTSSWWPQPVDTLGLGLARDSESGGLLFRGTALRDRLVLFTKLPPADERPTVELERARDVGERGEAEIVDVQVVSFQEGEISRLLASGAPGVYLLEAPDRSSSRGADEQSLDATHEEALRALGYIQ